MGFDPFSLISPARVNVLLVPAGQIQPERFDELVSQILKHTIVSLGDIVADEQIAKRPGLFSPTVFAAGRVLLDYSTSIDTQWIDSFPYELNRTPQVVIALSNETAARISHSNKGEPLKDDEVATTTFDVLLRSFQESVDQDQRPLVHCLAVFGDAQTEDVERQLTWCSVTGDRQRGNVASFVLSVAAAVLDVFDDLAKDYKGAVVPSPHLISQRRPSVQARTTRTICPQSSRLPPSVTRTPTTIHGVADDAGTKSNDSSLSANRGRVGLASPNSAISIDSLADNSRARHQILVGTLYLQAGRWPDALRELSEGAFSTRGHVVDTAWHAHALECLMVCLIMFAWAGLDFNIPQIYYASVEKGHGSRWASLTSQVNGITSAESSVASPQSLAKLAPGLHDAIMALHMNVSSTAQEQLPVLMLAELRIRLADLLAVICLQGGTLDKSALDHLVTGAALHADNSVGVGPPAVILRKHMIANLFAEAAEELPNTFPPKSSVDVLVAISSRLSKLGLGRIEAFYLRTLLQKLTPGLIDARKAGAAELGIHPAAAFSMQGSAAVDASSSVRSGVKSILQSVCEAYGLPRILSDTQQASFKSPDLAAIVSSVFQWSDMQASGDFLMKLEVLRLCAGVCEALPDLESGLQYNTRLLAFAKRSVTVSLDAKMNAPHFSQDEQIRLLNTIKRTVTTANKLGLPSLRAIYWDDFLVRGVDLLDSQSSERLIPHTPQELSLVTGAAKGGAKDPFIYNPLAPIPDHTSGDPVLVADEVAYFSVVLQNPYEFDVEVDSISILSEGCDFEATSHNIVLGHCCSQRFVLSGIPRSEGTLKVTGCRARIKDCYEQDFLILPRPFVPPGSVKKRRAMREDVAASLSKSLPNGQPKTKSAVATSPTTDFAATTVVIDVIRAQPSLSVERSSLSSASLMLLEGETRRLEITLKNNSDTATADLLLFKFDDSVTRQVQEALSNKSLGPFEIYELQLQLIGNPAVRWLPDGGPDERPSLRPGQARSFSFEVIGKPGLMDSTIQIDYANLGRPRSEVKEKFHTRQILLPITITVNGSIEIPRCNILPLSSPDVQATVASARSVRGQPEGTDVNSQCLVLLDFRNVWPYPLTVTLHSSKGITPHLVGSEAWTANNGSRETLQPGHVSRNVLVVPKAFVSDPHAPIPAIGAQRQFVVSASKVSIEAEAASREGFWYREELLKDISASWEEQETGRHGTIDIRRGIRLSARMIEALKVEPVDICFTTPNIGNSASTNDQHGPFQVSGTSPLTLAVGAFTKVIIKVHNRSQRKLHLLLRLQPCLRDQPHALALDLSKRFAWSGMLQRPLHPPLNPGEVREAELGITALATGQFQISATVEEIKAVKDSRQLDSTIGISVGAERMIWHSRDNCLVKAVSTIDS